MEKKTKPELKFLWVWSFWGSFYYQYEEAKWFHVWEVVELSWDKVKLLSIYKMWSNSYQIIYTRNLNVDINDIKTKWKEYIRTVSYDWYNELANVTKIKEPN